MTPVARMFVLLIATAVLPACVTQVSDAPKISVPGPTPLTLELNPGDALSLTLPNGDATVVVAEVEFAELHLDVRCPGNSRKCIEKAGEMRWLERRDGNGVSLELDRGLTISAEVTANIRIPHDHPLSVNMKYGTLSVEGIEQSLKIQMTAGDIDIAAPQRAVKRAFLRARFGDTSLILPRSAIQGRRPTLVGAKVDWPHGPGRHDIVAKLRFGDIRLELLD